METEKECLRETEDSERERTFIMPMLHLQIQITGRYLTQANPSWTPHSDPSRP